MGRFRFNTFADLIYFIPGGEEFQEIVINEQCSSVLFSLAIDNDNHQGGKMMNGVRSKTCMKSIFKSISFCLWPHRH